LSTTVKINPGDTFEGLARRFYGTDQYADNIASANPGVTEPLPVDKTLTIPDIPDAPSNKNQVIGGLKPNELALRFNGFLFKHYTDIEITRSIDQMDTVELNSPWDADNGVLKTTFKPFDYKKVTVEVGTEILFTGTQIAITPDLSPGNSTVALGCYSLPGVLNDCTPSASSFPLEYLNQNLKDIAQNICKPFGLSVVFKDDPGNAFDKVACKGSDRALSFLVELAKQRNLIISSTQDGKLLFQKSIDDAVPVVSLRQGNSPFVSAKPSFNPQQFYSNITGLEPVKIGSEGSQYTLQNYRLAGMTRPYTYTARDSDFNSLKTAVDSKYGRMHGGAVAYNVELATWRDKDGNLFEPNTMVKLFSPDAMIYTDYKFLIRKVQFKRSSGVESCVLDLVLPGSFSGNIPKVLPWDE